MTEVTVRPMAEFAGSFGSFTRIAAPSPDALEAVSDKYGTVVRSNEFNIPVPETLLVHSISDLKATEDWTPPIVVKDRYSVRWCGDKGMIGSTGYAYSRNELVEKVQEKLERVGDVLVQQFTRGVGVGFACLVLEGKITLPFQWLRVREKDPRGSGSSARISLPLQPGIIELSELLLKRASFTGPAMVEFKRELGSEQLTVMEINGRPWGSMQLPIQCGINYPLLLAQWYLDGRLPPERINYHTGITCRSIAADLTHLENLWGGTPLGWPVPYPNFLRSLFKVIIPWYPGLKSEEISWRDPKPGLFQIARWFASHMGGGN
ncbi:MAG TPA: hypothetical protein VG028_05785 [Terriglobia bacterium]|nr:hypothetical protein [Terriglobia bacterium]